MAPLYLATYVLEYGQFGSNTDTQEADICHRYRECILYKPLS